MTEEKILEMLDSNLKKAIQNNEFYEYLVGENDYLMVFKDSIYLDKNDPNLIIKGLNYFHQQYPEFKIKDYIEGQLLEMILSENIYKNYIALNFINAYLFNKKRNLINFELDIKKYSELLRKKLIQQKEILKNCNENDLLDILKKFEHDAFRYERDTGNKIL